MFNRNCSGTLNLATCVEVLCSPQNFTGELMSKVFTAEFKLEAAKLVLDQHYTLSEAAKAMNVSLSAINRWVKSLRMERQGKMPPGLPLTPELAELREMRKRIQRLEMENEILKKATALLMSDSLNSSR